MWLNAWIRIPRGPHAGGFHFAYAAGWGLFYALVQQYRPAKPHVGGPLLAILIYTLAFSPWGAATQSRTERPTHARPVRETLLHWTAALSFSLTLAYVFEHARHWLRPGISPTAREHAPR